MTDAVVVFPGGALDVEQSAMWGAMVKRAEVKLELEDISTADTHHKYYPHTLGDAQQIALAFQAARREQRLLFGMGTSRQYEPAMLALKAEVMNRKLRSLETAVIGVAGFPTPGDAKSVLTSALFLEELGLALWLLESTASAVQVQQCEVTSTADGTTVSLTLLSSFEDSSSAPGMLTFNCTPTSLSADAASHSLAYHFRTAADHDSDSAPILAAQYKMPDYSHQLAAFVQAVQMCKAGQTAVVDTALGEGCIKVAQIALACLNAAKAAAGASSDIKVTRVYNSTTPQEVIDLYREMRTKQTHERTKALTAKYCTFDHKRMSMWDALQTLRFLVDRSDPDLGLTNDLHALQTAAMMEKDGYPAEVVATGLVHDLGKMLYTFGCDEDGTSADTQWAVVGDTFATGYPIPNNVPFPNFNELNADHVSRANMYEPGCGLRNVTVSFGHDEYLYRVLKHNQSKHSLTEECMGFVRLHSLYPWHTGGNYTELEDDFDRSIKGFVQALNSYDLYSKSDDVESLSWDDPKWRALVTQVFGDELYDF